MHHSVLLIVAIVGLSSTASSSDASSSPISIAKGIGGEQLSISIDPARSAGAITSVKYRGVEYVDTFDHGRLIQSAVTLNDLGECLNPTEAGSYKDGSENRSTSKIVGIEIGSVSLKTKTRAAYWLAPGEKYGPLCGTDTRAHEAKNVMAISDYYITRSLTFDRSIRNLVTSRVEFGLPENSAEANFEGLTGYLPPEFDTFLSYDPITLTLRPLEWTRLERVTTEPIIISRPDGMASLGVVSPMIEADGPNGFFYAYFYAPGPGATAKWACVFKKRSLIAKSHEHFECDFAVGNVDEVIDALNHFTSNPDRSADVPVYGFYRGSKHFYTLSFAEGASAGMSFHGTAFHLRQTKSAHSIALYRCYTRSDDDHFASLRQDCEGSRTEGKLGYVYSAQSTGLVALYRFYKIRSRTHLITVDYAEGVMHGYTLDQRLGYVRL